MSDKQRLQIRRGPIRHPAGVATLRRVLLAAGYTASDLDIQDAYSAASEDEFAARWMDTSGMTDSELLAMVLRHLEPVAGDKCDGCGDDADESIGNLACCSHCDGLFCPDCCHSWLIEGGASGVTCEACAETNGRQEGSGP